MHGEDKALRRLAGQTGFDIEVDLMATASADGYFTSLNEAWEDVLGWSRAELMARPYVEFVHPDHVTATLSEAAKVEFADYKVLRFENRYEHKRGGWRWLRWYARSDGFGWTAVAFDITDEKGREQELRTALNRGVLAAYSQPIESQREERIAAGELLARLTPPGASSPLPAGEFIATAESCGLVGEIDLFMVGEALRVARPGKLAHVNVSARTFADPSASGAILEAVAASPVTARSLIVELTETAALDEIDAAREFADRLVRQGVRLALDDFGTRYASLSYLRELPVSCLKIDMSFVSNLVVEPADQRMVRSIIAIGRELEIETVAEGVENRQTLALLRAYGVDHVQGYLVGRPAPLVS